MGVIAHGVTQGDQVPKPTPLTNRYYLYVAYTLEVTEDRVTTHRATYRYQPTDRLRDPDWIFRYEYERAPDADGERRTIPRAHLHVNAEPAKHTGTKPFSRLHLPTRHVTLEQVIWHLIQDHGVRPNKDDWLEILWRNERAFRDIQRCREHWPYDPPFGDDPATTEQ